MACRTLELQAVNPTTARREGHVSRADEDMRPAQVRRMPPAWQLCHAQAGRASGLVQTQAGLDKSDKGD